MQSLEVISLVDNVIDQMSQVTSASVIRAARWVQRRAFNPHELLAVHGLALLVRLTVDNETHTVLYDTGGSGEVILRNARTLGVEINDIEGIALSHGHGDHTGGLIGVLKKIDQPVQVYLHPRSSMKRRVTYKTTSCVRSREIPTLFTIEEIIASGGEPVVIEKPKLLVENTMLLSGEIPRKTSYEKGFIGHQILIDGEWQDDQQVIDDRFAAIKVRDEGVVVLTGCSHAGIINILTEAVRLTGESRILGVIGGLHLVGPSNEPRITPTIRDLKQFNPSLIVPCHCTGWRARCAIAEQFGGSFANNGIGNLYRF